MTRLRRFLILTALLLVAAPAAANAATVVFPASSITATSLGLVSWIKGASAIQFAATLTGAVLAGTYVGTLGVTLFANIASITGGTCASSTAGFTTRCLFGSAWPIGTTINGNIATLLFTNLQILFSNAGLACLLVLTMTATYDRTTGLMTITRTTEVSRTPLGSGVCPVGSPNLRGAFAISPRLTWTL